MDEKEIKRIIRRAEVLEKRHNRLMKKINKLTSAYNNLINDMLVFAQEEVDTIKDIAETFGIELKEKEV